MTKLEIMYIVLGVLTGVFLGLVPTFRKLAQKTETKVDDNILEIAVNIVQWYEDNFKYKDGANKTARAITEVGMQVEKLGLKATDAVIDKAVERAVTIVEKNTLAKEELKKELTENEGKQGDDMGK